MSTLPRNTIITAFIATLVLLPGVVSAQQQENRQQAQGDVSQRQIARWVTMLNNSEIEMSSVALEQAETKQVKQFAEKMVREHQQLNEKLARHLRAPRENRTESKSTQEDGLESVLNKARETARTAAEAARKEIDERVSKQRNYLPLLALMQQVEQQTLEETKKILKQRKGAEFDRAYMIEQATTHLRAVQTLDVLSQQATGDLKQVLEQAKKATESHLQQAREIYNSLEQQ